MFVYRMNKGKKEFFVLRHRQVGNVVLTGHVEEGEKMEETVKREIEEELGAVTLETLDLNYQYTVAIERDQELSEEHAFLVRIPNEEVKFLAADEPHGWYVLGELENILTFEGQKKAVRKISI